MCSLMRPTAWAASVTNSLMLFTTLDIRDITSDAADAAMVRAILQMAEAFGMDTVAEGVETAAQLDFLQTHGCSYAQGHYFSEAVPYAEFSTYARVASKNGVGGN